MTDAAKPELFLSWKCVASYVGRSVRTIQRWEKQGMPVRRPAGPASKNRILVYRSELDRWMADFFALDSESPDRMLQTETSAIDSKGAGLWEDLRTPDDILAANRELVKQIMLCAGMLAGRHDGLDSLDIEVSWRVTRFPIALRDRLTAKKIA